MGAAVGGILLGYEVARQLGTKAIFVEKEDGVPRCAAALRSRRDDRALVVEDVVTTGLLGARGDRRRAAHRRARRRASASSSRAATRRFRHVTHADARVARSADPIVRSEASARSAAAGAPIDRSGLARVRDVASVRARRHAADGSRLRAASSGGDASMSSVRFVRRRRAAVRDAFDRLCEIVEEPVARRAHRRVRRRRAPASCCCSTSCPTR